MVSVSTDPANATLVQGTYIDLVCAVSTHPAVDTSTTVTTSWTGPNGPITTSSSEYTTTPLAQLPNTSAYITQLRVHRLDLGRDNGSAYSCTADVTPSQQDVYVWPATGNNTLTLNVQGMNNYNGITKAVLD